VRVSTSACVRMNVCASECAFAPAPLSPVRALSQRVHRCRRLSHPRARARPLPSRNPLHGIRGALELCRAPDLLPGVLSELLDSMSQGVDLMCTITNDLLDLEKLRCGKFVVKLTGVHLAELAKAVGDAARPSCTGTLEVFVDPSVPRSLLTDGLRLRQVLANGLSNACKQATNVLLVITGVEAPNGGRSILLRVLDDGPGLRGVDVSKLFDDFSAAANAVGHRGAGVRGSGLGLPICARLTRLMGGTLTVRDRTDVPHGAEFSLTLPWVLPPATPMQPQRHAIALLPAPDPKPGAAAYQPTTACTLEMNPTAPAPPAEDLASKPRARKRRVVVVDDAPLNRRIAERYVQTLGYDCLLLADGDEVEGAVIEAPDPVDIILMDIRMLRMDGDIACRQLRARGYTGPVIAVSGGPALAATRALAVCVCV
jgi:CheY-like chemotaxis protein